MPAAVLLLVEEVAGLLAVFDADEHPGVVLADLELVRHLAVHAALLLRQALFFAHGQIVALENAAAAGRARRGSARISSFQRSMPSETV
jgi:hypothetical protein